MAFLSRVVGFDVKVHLHNIKKKAYVLKNMIDKETTRIMIGQNLGAKIFQHYISKASALGYQNLARDRSPIDLKLLVRVSLCRVFELILKVINESAIKRLVEDAILQKSVLTAYKGRTEC